MFYMVGKTLNASEIWDSHTYIYMYLLINEKGKVNIFSNHLNDINKQSIKQINPQRLMKLFVAMVVSLQYYWGCKRLNTVVTGLYLT